MLSFVHDLYVMLEFVSMDKYLNVVGYKYFLGV